MARVLRVTLAIFAVAWLVVVSAPARAAIPTEPGYWCKLGSSTDCSYAAPLQACRAGNPNTNRAGEAQPQGSALKAFCYAFATGTDGYGWVYTNGTRCPANSVLIPGTETCSCNTGWVESEDKKSCVAPPPKCTAGKVVQGTTAESIWGNGAASGVFCVDGCQVYGTDRMKGPDGRWWVYGPFTESGGECEPPPSDDPPPPDTEPPNICKKGQCPGTVNGVEICVPCAETSDEPPKPKPPASGPPPAQPPGGQNNTNTTTTPNPGGGTTTTTTSSNSSTNCTGDKCTTTTTTTTTTTVKGPNGEVTSGPTSTTSTKTEDKPRSTFCAENPKSWMCTGPEASSYGGSCGGGFQCKGDAIQCAIAREQAVRNCKMFEPQGTQEENSYASAKGQSETNVTGTNPNNASIDVGSFGNTSPFPSSGSGVQDLSVTIMGRSVVLEFSKINQALEWMGSLILVMAWIAAYKIVTGGGTK